jgi:hypothetical protein
MLSGVALALSEIPKGLMDRHGLARRVYERGGEPEVQFLLRDRECLLPAWLGGRLCVLPWGSRRGESQRLPAAAWVRFATLEDGTWAELEPENVVIPASLGLDRGIWFGITEGVRGVVVHDEQGRAVVYPIIEPATHYYEVMVRSEWMPSLVGELI